jgi:hypothetical protein
MYSSPFRVEPALHGLNRRHPGKAFLASSGEPHFTQQVSDWKDGRSKGQAIIDIGTISYEANDS